MKSKVYGIIGVKAIMANWNADFSGYPRTTPTGEIFASDKSLKHTMKKMWENEGEKILYIRSNHLMNTGGKVTLNPRALTERYEYLFKKEVTPKTNTDEVLKNLFKALDVRNFGATFAEADNNLSIAGAVQIGQGMNFYESAQSFEQQIISPFRDKTSKELAQNTTIGTKIISDEAHYFYPFIINPHAYDNYVEIGVTDGYNENDYKRFKEAAICSVSAYATNSKSGCDNEFALFIETDNQLYLPNLTGFITFKESEDKHILDLKIGKLLEPHMDKIKSIEMYYDPTHLVVNSDMTGAKQFNIYTKEVL